MEGSNPEISRKLLAMMEMDQKARLHKENGEAIIALDQEHSGALKSIIQQIGWPTISKVGKEASTAAWLIAQHVGSDPEFQKQCLELMEEAGDDINPGDREYLANRIQTNDRIRGSKNPQ